MIVNIIVKKTKESVDQSKCPLNSSSINFGILIQSPVFITAVCGFCGESLYWYEVVNQMAMRRPKSYTFMLEAVTINNVS